jgi:hypothetical protein
MRGNSTVNSKQNIQTAGNKAISQNAMDIDWLTWGLVLLSVITLGGLVPFWVWIYMLYNPPGG